MTLVNVSLSHPTLLDESWTTKLVVLQCNAEDSAPDLALLETNEANF